MDMQMFVPAYHQDGDHLDMPFGQWPVEIAFFPYKDAQLTQDNDLAVARVYPTETAKLEQVVGQGLHPRTSTTNYFPRVSIIGYPGQWLPGDGPYDVARQR